MAAPDPWKVTVDVYLVIENRYSCEMLSALASVCKVGDVGAGGPDPTAVPP